VQSNVSAVKKKGAIDAKSTGEESSWIKDQKSFGGAYPGSEKERTRTVSSFSCH
jgi:hypothetical protein